MYWGVLGCTHLCSDAVPPEHPRGAAARQDEPVVEPQDLGRSHQQDVHHHDRHLVEKRCISVEQCRPLTAEVY